MIDTHQDYFNFTSSDLGNYWVCEKIYYSNSEEYFYYFLIAPGPLFSDSYFSDSHGYTFSGYDSVYCFPICFVSDGFYANSIILSNHDIYSARFIDRLVFQEPETENGTTLAPVIQREKTKGTLQEVLVEIIQMLPLITVVLVSFLGLRKALKTLLIFLNQS